MPETDEARFTVLLEALADGTPIDWAEAEATAKTEADRTVIRRLSRIGRFATLKRNSAAPGRAAMWSHLQLLEKIGEGAFGDVYRAHDPRLARDVALKLLHEPVSDDGRRASSVIEEGRLLARIRHPNVVTVYGAESLNGQVGIWTEFIDGQTLHAIVTEHGPLPIPDVASIGLDLCRALAAVHDAGLLHRDIKAQNVMRETGGRIVLMDFGTGRDRDLVPKGDVSGTPLYLAPELFAGGEASAASDVYALGVLLFFLLTGSYPVVGRTLKDVRDGHLAGSRASVREKRSEAPVWLADAIERGLAHDPERRFGSAREFERALLAGQPAVTDLAAGGGPNRGLLTVAMALAGLVVVGGAWWWSSARGVPNAGATASSPPAAPNRAASSAADAPTPAQPVPVVTAPAAKPEAAAAPHVAVGTTETVIPNLVGEVASITADGRLLAQIADDGDVVIHDLASGVATKLGVKDSTDRGFADYPVFSRDSKRVAYRWSSSPDAKPRLGVVEVSGVAGARPRLFVGPDASVLLVHDWSKDGQSVLVTLEVRGEHGATHQLAWVSLRDGRPTTVKEFDPLAFWMWPLVRVSPDGSQIAYSAVPPPERPGTARHIYLLAADGSRDEPLITTTAENINPIWSADGTRLLYTSDLGAKVDVWSIPIREGVAAGQPEIARADVGKGNALGLTADGWYFYRSYRPGVDTIFVAPIPDRPALLGEMIRPTFNFVGYGPKWSPDGQSIAFRRKPEGNTVNLFVMPMQSRVEALVHSLDAPRMPLLWLGQTGLLEQPKRRPAGPLDPRPPNPPRRFDLTTRELIVVGSDLERDIRLTNASALTADGKTLYAGAFGSGGLVDRLVAVDVATGQAVPVYPLPDELVTARNPIDVELALSPNGRELAVVVFASKDKKARLFRIGIDGQAPQVLYGPYWSNGPYEELAWTKGGIFFGEAAPPSGRWQEMKSWRVMRIAPTGGSPQPVFKINGPAASFDISPDGSQIALNPRANVSQPFDSQTGPKNELRRIFLGPIKGGGG